ncbi:hypothetical protein CSB09_04390 [Candidatus Gracilibacteria bacterium]|nr:MAG: hypothetical protein CSB09_04390 [Candidatus Gracilibacteria bacterium]
MRNARNRRRNNLPFSWGWIAIIGVLIIGIFLIKVFGGEDVKKGGNDSDEYLEITPMENSQVFISDQGKSETKISKTQKLYTSDAYALVRKVGAMAKNNSINADLGESTRISYQGKQDNMDTFTLKLGWAWVQSDSDQGIKAKMDHFDARIDKNDIALLQQTNNTFSTLYAIRGSIDIITSAGQYSLPAGKRIMISASDLTNPNVNLADFSGNITEGITKNSLFIKNNGISILESSTNENNTDGDRELVGSGNTTLSSNNIEFTQPSDGIALKTNKTTIMGNILNTDVKRVTINDIDTAVSPVNKTFTLENFEIKNEINNLVYKVYDTNNTLIEKGVLVVYGPKGGAGDAMLVPTNYPLSDKDFKITSPRGNPYKTTSNYVKVRGTVPANRVEYIVVNDYRLRKYIPKSTTWYYHANANIGTMKNGMNLYEIKFYDAQNKLLSKRLFTIIKENPHAQTVSGETR